MGGYRAQTSGYFQTVLSWTIGGRIGHMAADTAIYVTHFKPRKVETGMGWMATKAGGEDAAASGAVGCLRFRQDTVCRGRGQQHRN